MKYRLHLTITGHTIFKHLFSSGLLVVSHTLDIPDICHFFTQSIFLENKIYSEKRQFFALNL